VDISNTGYFSWTPDSALGGPSNYRLKIFNDSDPTDYQITGLFKIATADPSPSSSISFSQSTTSISSLRSSATPSPSVSTKTGSGNNLTAGQLVAVVVASVTVGVVLIVILISLNQCRKKHTHSPLPRDSEAPPLPPRLLSLPPFPELETNANRIELEAEVKRKEGMATDIAADENERKSLLEGHKLVEKEAKKLEKNIEPKVMEQKAADEDDKRSLIGEHELGERTKTMNEKEEQEGGGRNLIEEQHEVLARYRENADDYSVIGEAGVIEETGKVENLKDEERKIAREYYEPVFYSPGKKAKQDARLSIYR
jgi:hypothetical protein